MTTPEAIIEALKVTMENIDDVKLHFKLKQYRAKYMDRSKDLLKACIALDQLGLTITTAITSALTNHSFESMSTMLHTLGDKHLIVLKRKAGYTKKGYFYEWLLHPTFKALLLDGEGKEAV